MNASSRDQLEDDGLALAVLSEYLELSLDKGRSLILVRRRDGTSDVYLGEPDEPLDDWIRRGTIRSTSVSAILALTRSGLNELAINGQSYRFFRMFAQIEDQGGIVFAAA